MKTPKILKWRLDKCPPVHSEEFFNVDNVVELSAWSKEAYDILLMAMSAIVKHGSPELINRYEEFLLNQDENAN